MALPDPDGYFDFATNKSMTSDLGGITLTCVRASEAWFWNDSGLLEAAAVDEARFQHLAVAPYTSLGILPEDAQTNLALRSQEFDNAVWSPSNMTVTANTGVAPDGATTADKLTATAANATLLQSITSASADRAFGLYMRRITGTGTINMTVDNGTTWTAKVLTADWQRFDLVQNAVTNPIIGVRIVTSGDEIEVWQADLHTGRFVSSMIPTTSASATRALDLISADVDIDAGGFGTYYAEGYQTPYTNNQGAGQLDPAYFRFRGGGGSNDILTCGECLNETTNSTSRVVNGAGNTPTVTTNFGAVAGEYARYAITFALNDVIHYRNGTAGATDVLADAQLFGSGSVLRIGYGASATGQWSAPISKIAWWNGLRADNADLDGLSDGTIPPYTPPDPPDDEWDPETGEGGEFEDFLTWRMWHIKRLVSFRR